MHTGRKILNLRCDRKISQQDLARACNITPSALSKIEAGINSPRANIIWRIAKNLGVTVEYLLDEEIPYPYKGYSYRQELLTQNIDPQKTVRVDVSLEERAFLDALRNTHEIAREIVYAIPEAPVESVRLVHFLMNHSKIQNPSTSFLKTFESLLTTGAIPTATATSAKAKKKTAAKRSSKARKASAGRSPRARKKAAKRTRR